MTIAAAEIVRLLLLSTTWIETTGSADGLVAYANDFRSINPFPDGTYGFGPWSYTANQFWVLIFAPHHLGSFHSPPLEIGSKPHVGSSHQRHP